MTLFSLIISSGFYCGIVCVICIRKRKESTKNQEVSNSTFDFPSDANYFDIKKIDIKIMVHQS